MTATPSEKFTIVGGGPAGSMTAAYLGQAGYDVTLYEMRSDMRKGEVGGNRSINLALSLRGIEALAGIGLADEVLASAVPMMGRMIHSPTGKLSFQRYGKDDAQVINSVPRTALNAALLTTADRHANVAIHFDQKCTGVNLRSGELTFGHTITGTQTTVNGGTIISADGAFSAIRRPMQKLDRFNYRQEYLKHGYKELTIPPGPGSSWRIDKNALHIWPRRSYMMIALPNLDGSFTCTLFWPFEGPNSFAAIQTEAEIRSFFARNFPDAVPHMPTFAEEYVANPVGSLATIRCGPWHLDGRVLLLGDAAHAVVPFYGQGMNAAFEDVLVLDQCMRKHKPRWDVAFRELYELRKESVDTLADMAIHNFVEMRDHTGSTLFLLKKKGERFLHKLFPNWYQPLYSMATFTRMPYTEVIARSKHQNRVVAVVATFLLLIVAALLAWALIRS